MWRDDCVACEGVILLHVKVWLCYMRRGDCVACEGLILLYVIVWLCYMWSFDCVTCEVVIVLHVKVWCSDVVTMWQCDGKCDVVMLWWCEGVTVWWWAFIFILITTPLPWMSRNILKKIHLNILYAFFLSKTAVWIAWKLLESW